MRAGGLASAPPRAYVALEGAATALALPGATRRATGSYEVSSLVPQGMPVTSWLLDVVPAATRPRGPWPGPRAAVVRQWTVDGAACHR